MYCSKCGAKNKAGSNFCCKCGSLLDNQSEKKVLPQKKKLPIVKILLILLGATLLYFAAMFIRTQIVSNRVTQGDLNRFVNSIVSSEQDIEDHLDKCLNQLENGIMPGNILRDDYVDFEVRENRIIRNHSIVIQCTENIQKRSGWKKVINHNDYEALYQAYKDLYELSLSDSVYELELLQNSYASLKVNYERCLNNVRFGSDDINASDAVKLESNDASAFENGSVNIDHSDEKGVLSTLGANELIHSGYRVEYEICNDGKLNEYRYDENGILRSVVGDVSIEQFFLQEPTPLLPGNTLYADFANFRMDEEGRLYDWYSYDDFARNQYGPGPILSMHAQIWDEADGSLSVHIWTADGDDKGTTTYTFDEKGRLIRSLKLYGAWPPEKTALEYDDDGHLLSVTNWTEREEGVRKDVIVTTYKWEDGVLVGWDKVHTDSGQIIEYVDQGWYDGLRTWAELVETYRNEFKTTSFEYSYDENGRLTEIRRQRITLGGPETRWRFLWDENGRLSFYACYNSSNNGDVYSVDKCWSYEYDEYGRLLAAYERDDECLYAVLAGESLPFLQKDESDPFDYYNDEHSYSYLRNDDGSLRILYMGIGPTKDPVLYTGDWGGTLSPGIEEEEYDFD